MQAPHDVLQRLSVAECDRVEDLETLRYADADHVERTFPRMAQLGARIRLDHLAITKLDDAEAAIRPGDRDVRILPVLARDADGAAGHRLAGIAGAGNLAGGVRGKRA